MKVLGKFYHITAGLIFLLLGFGAIALSVTFYLNPVQPVKFDDIKSSKVMVCSIIRPDLSHENISASVVGDKVLFTIDGVDDWKSKINLSSFILSNCEGMSLNKFCFGESCNIAEMTGDRTRPAGHNGLFMELIFDDSNIDPRVKRDW